MPVLGFHVLDLRLLEFEKAVTFPTVMVNWASYVVSSPLVEAPKFGVTAIAADPVGIRILVVLLQGTVVWEQSLTTNTIRHWMIVVRNEEGGSHSRGIDLEFK